MRWPLLVVPLLLESVRRGWWCRGIKSLLGFCEAVGTGSWIEVRVDAVTGGLFWVGIGVCVFTGELFVVGVGAGAAVVTVTGAVEEHSISMVKGKVCRKKKYSPSVFVGTGTGAT